jgi:hypothetical protein
VSSLSYDRNERLIGRRTYKGSFAQSVEIDEEELCEMKDRLLQKEIALARLNPSSEDTLNEYLNSDGQMLLKLPLRGEEVNLQAN